MGDPTLEAALRRLAACDDRLPIDASRGHDALAADGWIAAEELADPAAWPAIARAYAAGIGTERLAVGGSCALQGYAWRVAGLAIGTWALTGTVLDLGPGRVRVRMSGGRTLGVAAPEPRAVAGSATDRWAAARPAPAGEPRDAGALADELLLRHLAPVVAASRAASRLSARVAWGNVASSCASVLGLLDRALPAGARSAWRADAAQLVAAAQWPAADLVGLTLLPGPDGDVLAHERRTCCLLRLAPGREECGTCERLDPAARRARLVRHAATAPRPRRLEPVPAGARA